MEKTSAYQTYNVGQTWYIKRHDHQIWGTGTTLEEAFANLYERENEYDTFCSTVGLPTLDTQAIGVGWKLSAGRVWRFVRVVVIVALCMVPVSYAISSGITRGIHNADIQGGRAFWGKVEERILDMGADGKGLPPEKAAALHHAMENIVARLRPFTSQLGLLFVPPEEDRQDLPATEQR